MAQVKYQKLRPANLQAARLIYENLKQSKCLSAADFKRIFLQSRTNLPSDAQFNNWETTVRFLEQHGLMTQELINGLTVYMATQKCVRTKSFKNATVEYQTVLQSNIQKAIQLQKLNANLVPAEIEGTVIANLLELEGTLKMQFIKWYPEAKLDMIDEHMDFLGEDRALYAIIRCIDTPLIKKIENVSY